MGTERPWIMIEKKTSQYTTVLSDRSIHTLIGVMEVVTYLGPLHWSDC
jgi:hypothetical protein